MAKITPKSKVHLGPQYRPRPQTRIVLIHSTHHRLYSFPVIRITAAFTDEDRDHPELSSYNLGLEYGLRPI